MTLQIVPMASSLLQAPVDLLVLGVYARALTELPVIAELDTALQGELLHCIREIDFEGRLGATLTVRNGQQKLAAKRLVLVGLGDADGQANDVWVRLGGMAVRLGNQVGAKHVGLWTPPPAQENTMEARQALLGRGVFLGAYRYTAYKSDGGRPASVIKVHLAAADASAAGKQACKHAAIIAQAVARTRDLVNTPAMDLYPESLAAQAKQWANEHGVHCAVLGPKELARKKMNLLLGVGQASVHTPRLVHLKYTPKGKKGGAPVVLVGKGITFDSGGLCLKSPDAMYGMKVDMAGAAATLCTVIAAAQMRLDRPVHGIMALAENSVSGNAYRPGDVIVGAAGKSIEVNNTDAEGRLVLADALHYARSIEPALIIDLATLTGACMIALGHKTVGLFSNDDGLAEALLGASAQAGEHFWRMPLTPTLRDQLNSDIADMRNTGERYGGAITAALFLREFVGTTPWAHLDIAGPASSAQDDAASTTKGGTGVAVATLLHYLQHGEGARVG